MNPTVNPTCKGSRFHTACENLMPDLRWSWGGNISTGEWLQIQIIISRDVWLHRDHNPIHEWQVTTKLNLVAGFKPESHFSLHVALLLFYLPLPPTCLFPTLCTCLTHILQANKLTLAKMRRKQTPLGSFFWKRGKDPMMQQKKTLRVPIKRNLHLKENTESYLSSRFIATGDLAFPKPALYNMWRLAIQQNH